MTKPNLSRWQKHSLELLLGNIDNRNCFKLIRRAYQIAPRYFKREENIHHINKVYDSDDASNLLASMVKDFTHSDAIVVF